MKVNLKTGTPKTPTSKTTDTVIVCYDFTHGEDKCVLVVGRKQPGDSVDIINAFEGEEALELYEKLVKKSDKESKT